MKKISIMIMVLVVALASCKKTPEVNLKYVDVERDLVTVGTTTANIQCDYDYIATLKKAYLFYGEGTDEADFTSAEMCVLQNTLYVEMTGLKRNTTYNYYYEFHNGFNSMRTALKSFKTEAGNGGGEEPPTPEITLPTVITAVVTEITTNSAKGGGEVTNDGGAEVTERGICWSTSENPTLSDNHVASGTGTGAFTAMMDNLEANTTYHVRAYATNEVGTAYGLNREFVTVGGGSGEHEWVDLGLPSGTLWSTCNVGANSPEEYGDYFAWAETQPKDDYDWSTYKYCNGSETTLTKYCDNSVFGYNGFTDTLTILQSIDDAATANWGNDWCMPTKEQWKELFDNTSSIWTTQNDIDGRLFIASNGNSLFLPATFTGEAKNSDRIGLYWSKTLDEASCGMFASFGMYNFYEAGYARCYGLSVRPVRKTDTPTPPGNVPEGAINGLFTINANGDQVYFSQGNLQYQASTNTWRFAENQWNFVGTQIPDEQGYMGGNVNGSDNRLISSTYTGWIDLFGWGTSGWDCGNVYYHPWDSASFNTESLYGPEGFNLTDSYANSDWGVFNSISNGGNTINTWRTLTRYEWEYMINSRNTTSGVRFAKAKVSGINGLLLLPDNWDANSFDLSNTNSNLAHYDSNVLTFEQLVILEKCGIVFLPAAGGRISDIVRGVGLYGGYWSVSGCGDSGIGEGVACFLNFSEEMFYPAWYDVAC